MAEEAHGPDRVVIVGAGFGGLTAARKLAGHGFAVTVIDRRNHHLFQPLLYQVATAALSPADIAVPIRSILPVAARGGVEVLLEEVTGVDAEHGCVRTRSGLVREFDQLIIATGSQYDYFGHDAWKQHARSLKSLEDATEIRRRVLLAFERAETEGDEARRRRLLTFVVVGGGPTGVETAGALAELAKSAAARDFKRVRPEDTRILLLEAADRVLAGFTKRQQDYTIRTLERLGVEVKLKAAVEQVTGEGATAGGVLFASANVLWCAGVKANPAGAWLGADMARNGAVKVSPDMSVPGHPNIFVIGDGAYLEDPDGVPYPALAPVAKQQGAHVAAILKARREGRALPPRFRYRDWGSLATIGRSAAVGKFGRFGIQGFLAWIFWGAVHITYLIGFRNRAVVAVNWLWAWVTYGKGARLITGSTELEQDGGSDRTQPGSPSA